MFSDLMDSSPVALFRPSMMSVVLDIVMENVPDPIALNLSGNNLYALDKLTVLALKFSNIRALHIGRNQVS
jgi:hypothetical protein